jgi:hypothetical protein
MARSQDGRCGAAIVGAAIRRPNPARFAMHVYIHSWVLKTALFRTAFGVSPRRRAAQAPDDQNQRRNQGVVTQDKLHSAATNRVAGMRETHYRVVEHAVDRATRTAFGASATAHSADAVGT